MFEYRPLGATELTFTRWNKQGVGRFYWVMGLDGPDIDSQLLNDAVRITVKRIPGLRSRLKRGMMETVPFEECPPLQVPVVEQDCDVISFTERLLKDTAFESSDESPYPFVLVLHRRPASAATGETSGPSQHLVAIMKHAFSDGISAASWSGELVELLAKLHPMSAEERAAVLQETVALAQPPSTDAQLLHHAKDRGDVGTALKNVVTMYQEKLSRLAKGDAPDFSTPLSGVFNMRRRRSRFAVATLPAAALTAVLSACRSHGTTIGGAVGAACFTAMQNTIFKPKGKLASLVIDVPLNTRPFSSFPADPSGRPSHQLHMLPADVLLGAREISCAEEFWSTAREFQEAVHDFSKHPERIPDVLDFHKWLSHPLSIPVSRVVDRSAGLMLSNLGRTDNYCRLPPGSVFKPGPAYLGIQMVGFGQSLVVTLWTLRGEMHVTTTYTEPVIPKYIAQRFTEAVVQTLATYADVDTAGPETEGLGE